MGKIDDLIAALGRGTPVVPAPNRWWTHPAQNPGPQSLIEKALAAGGLRRADMVSGAFLDPRTGEVLDGRAFSGGGVVAASSAGRPAMAVSDEMSQEDWLRLSREVGPVADTNLVRRSVGWEPLADEVDVPFLATVESGPSHFYGKGIAFDSPVLLRNTGGTHNPTLRPRARGSIWGDGQIGEMLLRGRSHPVYDILRIAPRGEPRSGTLLRYGVLAPLLMQDGE
jgi:hypothetical protein